MSNINNQKRNNKKNIYGDRLKVEVSTGEKSPVCTNTPTTMSYQSGTHSGKIRAEQPPTSPTLSNQAYKEAGTDYASFNKLHTLVHTIIIEWLTLSTVISHPFYQQWQPIWTNIKADIMFATIKQKLRLKSISEYKDHIQQCPAVGQHLNMWLNHTGSKICYAHIQHPNITSDLTDPTTCTRAHQDDKIPSFADLLEDATTNETDEENKETPNVA